MSNFALYIIGYLFVIAGLAWGAHLLGIGPRWIAVGALILLGMGVAGGVSRTRRREPPSS